MPSRVGGWDTATSWEREVRIGMDVWVAWHFLHVTNRGWVKTVDFQKGREMRSENMREFVLTDAVRTSKFLGGQVWRKSEVQSDLSYEAGLRVDSAKVLIWNFTYCGENISHFINASVGHFSQKTMAWHGTVPKPPRTFPLAWILDDETSREGWNNYHCFKQFSHCHVKLQKQNIKTKIQNKIFIAESPFLFLTSMRKAN